MMWIGAHPLWFAAYTLIAVGFGFHLWRVTMALWRSQTERIDSYDPPKGIYLETEHGDKHYLIAHYHGRRRFGSRMKAWVVQLDDGIALDIAEGRLQVRIGYLPKHSVLMIQGTA